MWLWIVLVVMAVMAALLIYAACCVDGDIDRQSEAHPPKSKKGRDDGKVFLKEKHHYVTSVPICALKGQKTMCAADMSAIFGICHPLTIPQSFAIDLRRKNESTR